MARKTKKDEKKRKDDDAADRIAQLEQQCEDLNARWLRAQADYKNLRRRAITDTEAALKREVQPLLEELLLVLDFLDMALSSTAESQDAKNLLMGIEMTRTKFVQALETAQLKPIATDGLFDPAIHEAAETRVEPDAAPGSIVSVVRRGYTWHEQVLRAAVVVVATDEDGEVDAAAPAEPPAAAAPAGVAKEEGEVEPTEEEDDLT